MLQRIKMETVIFKKPQCMGVDHPPGSSKGMGLLSEKVLIHSAGTVQYR